MMEELQQVKKVAAPTETLLVVDGMTGQNAVKIAESFNEAIDFDGVVLTKMDGDARGGAALLYQNKYKKTYQVDQYWGTLASLEVFHPERIANRILGMGDVISLVEEIEAVRDAAQEKILQKKIQKNQFDFAFLQIQLQQIKKGGYTLFYCKQAAFV